MFKGLNSKALEVGGCVRDPIMGKTPHDIDYIIEKTTPEQFREVFLCPTGLENCKDCKAKCAVPCVGESFHVYLVQGNETALAREEEKKLGDDSYQGFIVKTGVSIEEDLGRRDYTMNSIAKRYLTGEIIDPFGGVDDIKAKLLRCINPVAFIEDPLRIYRGARFVARFHLNVDLETEMLMAEHAGNLAHVLPERVYAELKKVYDECDKPSSFFYFLQRIDALRIHFKPLYLATKVSAGPVQWHGGKSTFVHLMDSFDYAKEHGYSFDVALAALFHDTGKGITPKDILPNHHGHEKRSHAINRQYVKQHRFTSKQEDMIVCFGLNHMKFHFIESMNPTRLIRFYKSIKKYADEFIQCANCDTPLNQNQLAIIELTKKAIKDTVIELPRGCKDPAAFVEGKQSHTLKGLLNVKNSKP